MIFVGIDPGVRACGVAVCDEWGTIARAWWERERDCDLSWCVADELKAWPGCCVAIEFPRTYGGRSRVGDTNDLLELAYVVGRLERMLETSPHVGHVLRVGVDTWKRGIPTEKLEARLLTPGGLSPAERDLIEWPAKSYRHNVVDAIALARWTAEWVRNRPGKNINDYARL